MPSALRRILTVLIMGLVAPPPAFCWCDHDAAAAAPDSSPSRSCCGAPPPADPAPCSPSHDGCACADHGASLQSAPAAPALPPAQLVADFATATPLLATVAASRPRAALPFDVALHPPPDSLVALHVLLRN